METTPTIGSIVEVRETGHRGTVEKIGGVTSSGVPRPVVFVSWSLHGATEPWAMTHHELDALDLVLEARGDDRCLYCWGDIPAERIPAPRWDGAERPPRTKASRYCQDAHQKADARWVSANRAALTKAYDRTPVGTGRLAPGARKPGPGRQTITPPEALTLRGLVYSAGDWR